jgi:hypothetical protein
MVVKYATAIRIGIATTEPILRRFTRNASHPVYQAMLALGRAQKTIFVCRYLRDRDLQREVNSGLNIVEGWHGVRRRADRPDRPDPATLAGATGERHRGDRRAGLLKRLPDHGRSNSS